MTGTVGQADIYGLPSGGGGYAPIGVMNPNGDAVSPPSTQTASGGADTSAGGGAAGGLLGIIAALVLLRIVIHLAGEEG